MDRKTTCCFTGHRPDKLPWKNDETDPRCCALKQALAQAVERAYGDGYRHFICGMARGADFYFGEAVLALRDRHPDITFEAARPCESQPSSWPAEDQLRYQYLLERADYETLVQHHYDPGCMMRRNRYMVDRSNRLIAVYDGVPKGGTAQTLMYGLRQGLETEILPVEGEIIAE